MEKKGKDKDRRRRSPEKTYTQSQLDQIVDQILKRKMTTKRSPSTSSSSSSSISVVAMDEPPATLQKSSNVKEGADSDQSGGRREWKVQTKIRCIEPPVAEGPSTSTQSTASEGKAMDRNTDYIKGVMGRRYRDINSFIQDFNPDHRHCCSRKLRKPCPFYNKGHCYNLMEHSSSRSDRKKGEESLIYGHFCSECFHATGLKFEHTSVCPGCPLRKMALAKK